MTELVKDQQKKHAGNGDASCSYRPRAAGVSSDFLRPKTRGELIDALNENVTCEVVATNEEITTLLLNGYFPAVKFNVKMSDNDGWVIYESN